MVAAQGSTNLTLLDIAKRTDPTGAVPVIAELLTQNNEILNDIPWREGNTMTGARNSIRTGLPQGYWKTMNTGTPASKSTVAQIDEACGILEAYSEIDFDLANMEGNVNKYRLSEASAFIESLSQQFVAQLFYGNSTINSDRFMGLSPRFGAISGAVNGQNVMTAGGSGSCSSVWLIGWGENTVYGIYPRGTIAGLQHKDWGEQIMQTSVAQGQGLWHVYIDKWQWKCGISVKDWRYVARIANISVSDLTGGTGTQNAQQLINLLARLQIRIPNMSNIRPCFYMNRTMYSMLMVQALSKSQNALSIEQGLTQFGTPNRVMSFMGIPIRLVDQLLLTESAIS